jgi:isoleucyl-tRNA synthetase
VQALRKELGFKPTDVLDAVHLAELDDESVKLLKPYLKEMAELVRTKEVSLHKNKDEVDAKWHEYKLDNQRLYVAISND